MTTTLPTPTPAAQPTPALAAPAATTGTPVLALIGFLCALVAIPLGAVIPLSIVAIVLGALALSREPQGRTLAIWSIVLGAVPGAIVLVGGMLAAAFVVPFGLWAAVVGG